MENQETVVEAVEWKLPAIKTLISDGYTYVRNNLGIVWRYAGVLLLSMIVLLAPIAGVLAWLAATDTISTGMYVVAGVIGVMSFVIGLALMVLAATAATHAVTNTESTSFKVSWRWALSNFWSIAWVGLLGGMVILGGSLFFILPGMVVGLYTMLYIYTYIHDGARGMDALVSSTRLIYGNFWAVFGRLAVIWLLTVLVMFIVDVAATVLAGLVGYAHMYAAIAVITVGEIIGLFLQFAITIFILKVLSDIYMSLRVRATAFESGVKTTSRTIYTVLGWIGVILLVGGSVFAGQMLQQVDDWSALFVEDSSMQVEYNAASFEAEIEAMLQAEGLSL